MTFASLWASTLETYGPRQVELVGLATVQTVSFWLPSAIYLSLDRLAPSFSARHKLQPAPRQPTAADIRHCAAVVLRNNVLAMALGLVQIFLLSDSRSRRDASSPPPPLFNGCRLRVEPQLPSLLHVVRDLFLCCVIREILFYYSHRLLHQPRLYRAIHKTHHHFVAPVALAAQYAHPVEHIVANILPVGLPPMLVGAHVLTNWAFVALMLAETATVHSGYDFFDGAARMHDAHHEKFNLNYGVFGWLDWLHGTDKLKRRQKAKTESM